MFPKPNITKFQL